MHRAIRPWSMATLGVVELSGSVRPTAAGECWKGPDVMVERDDLVALTATEAARRIRARSHVGAAGHTLSGADTGARPRSRGLGRSGRGGCTGRGRGA